LKKAESFIRNLVLDEYSKVVSIRGHSSVNTLDAKSAERPIELERKPPIALYET
jgi:hypothetical protein